MTLANPPSLEALESRTLLAAYIEVGDHELLPDTPDQQIEIHVSGDVEAQGVNLNAQIADGGVQLGGEVDGPAISSVNILDGTIFEANNTGTEDLDGSGPDIALQWEGRDTTTVSGTVTASGLVATLTIDTTGYTSGTWTLSLADTLNGPSDFAGVPIKIADGSIAIIERPRPLTTTRTTRKGRPDDRNRPTRTLTPRHPPAHGRR